MNAHGQIRLFILEALDRTSGDPMPESALVTSVQLAHRHLHASLDDVRSVILTLEADGLLSGTRDPVTEQTLWVLTPKGTSAFRSRR